MKVKRLAGAMGAEIFDVDLSSALSDSAFAEVRKAFDENVAVFFPGQKLSPANITNFVSRFGTPLEHPYLKPLDPAFPFVHELRKEPSFELNYGGAWHMDFTFAELPSAANSLYARVTPEFGGDTMFVSLYHAYDALSQGMKQTFKDARIVNSTTADLAERLSTTPGARDDAVESLSGQAIHPLFRTIPETGEKCLYLDPGAAKQFEGMSVEESRPIIDYLIEHLKRPEFQFRYTWAPDVFGIWDNRCCLHYGLNDYPGQTRIMHRMVAMDTRRPF